MFINDQFQIYDLSNEMGQANYNAWLDFYIEVKASKGPLHEDFWKAYLGC